MRWMVLTLFAAPAFGYLVYRLAKGLGFLEPPINKEHEYRRTILVSLYTFLLFLPVLIYGFEKGWPRAWILFGILNGLVLVVFATSGVWSAMRLWRLRHPEPAVPEVSSRLAPEDPPVDFETGHEVTREKTR